MAQQCHLDYLSAFDVYLDVYQMSYNFYLSEMPPQLVNTHGGVQARQALDSTPAKDCQALLLVLSQCISTLNSL